MAHFCKTLIDHSKLKYSEMCIWKRVKPWLSSILRKKSDFFFFSLNYKNKWFLLALIVFRRFYMQVQTQSLSFGFILTPQPIHCNFTMATERLSPALISQVKIFVWNFIKIICWLLFIVSQWMLSRTSAQWFNCSFSVWNKFSVVPEDPLRGGRCIYANDRKPFN